MHEHVLTRIQNHIGFITLDRPKALNSLSLGMIRALTATLMAWESDSNVKAVVIHGSQERAFCAGGDIRFFYDTGTSTPKGDSALLEDFFTEEYALNYLIHFYPKPYIALMNGVVMGGGMGIAQAGPESRVRIVTEKTKMAMPEVNIGLFPDVGGGYFLSRCAGGVGAYLGLTGETIGAADAIEIDLADLFLPSEQVAALMQSLESSPITDVVQHIQQFCAPYRNLAGDSKIAQNRATIDRHFTLTSVAAICASLQTDATTFAQQSYATMQTRSPLMMCVTLEQLRRSAAMSVADCLRLERTLVRHCFKHGEVLEGVRALVVDKDQSPQWNPARLEDVSEAIVQEFFQAAWPDYAHPLRFLS